MKTNITCYLLQSSFYYRTTNQPLPKEGNVLFLWTIKHWESWPEEPRTRSWRVGGNLRLSSVGKSSRVCGVTMLVVLVLPTISNLLNVITLSVLVRLTTLSNIHIKWLSWYRFLLKLEDIFLLALIHFRKAIIRIRFQCNWVTRQQYRFRNWHTTY